MQQVCVPYSKSSLTARSGSYEAPSSLMESGALLVGTEEAPPFDENKLVKLGLRVVVADRGGDPKVGMSNRLPFSESGGEVGPVPGSAPPGPAVPLP